MSGISRGDSDTYGSLKLWTQKPTRLQRNMQLSSYIRLAFLYTHT